MKNQTTITIEVIPRSFACGHKQKYPKDSYLWHDRLVRFGANALMFLLTQRYYVPWQTGCNVKAENTHSLHKVKYPVWLVWIQLFCCIKLSTDTCLAKSKPVKQEVSRTVILPLTLKVSFIAEIVIGLRGLFRLAKLSLLHVIFLLEIVQWMVSWFFSWLSKLILMRYWFLNQVLSVEN